MAMGQRIKFFRRRKGITQKQLGESLGFHGKTSDVRIAQYEAGIRTPRVNLMRELARVLDVSPQALDVPDIDTEDGLIHTLFALEDMYGLKICEVNGAMCLRLNKSSEPKNISMFEMLHAWQMQAAKLENQQITKEEYDEWRYKYPKLDINQL